jgi:nucleotide-binding universal stress UspA family protein
MRIVIGYDGSKASTAALKDLANAGLPRKAQVRVIHAVPPLLPLESLAPTGTEVTWYAEAYKTALANQKATMDRALAQAKEAVALLKSMFPSWTVVPKTCVDVPAHAILELAEAWKADLIVAGSNGWNELGKLVLGSVADKLLNHAHCTVRLGRGATRLKPQPPRLLFAFDGSPYAEEAVRRMAGRHWPKGTQARLLAVSEFQLRMGDISLAVSKALSGKNGKGNPWPWMEAKIQKAGKALQAAGIRTEGAMIIDEPRRAILEQARKFKADAIILGTHGHTGIRRFLLGSVSASVAAHAPCTVEIVRAPAIRKGK